MIVCKQKLYLATVEGDLVPVCLSWNHDTLFSYWMCQNTFRLLCLFKGFSQNETWNNFWLLFSTLQPFVNLCPLSGLIVFFLPFLNFCWTSFRGWSRVLKVCQLIVFFRSPTQIQEPIKQVCDKQYRRLADFWGNDNKMWGILIWNWSPCEVRGYGMSCYLVLIRQDHIPRIAFNNKYNYLTKLQDIQYLIFFM